MCTYKYELIPGVFVNMMNLYKLHVGTSILLRILVFQYAYCVHHYCAALTSKHASKPPSQTRPFKKSCFNQLPLSI